MGFARTGSRRRLTVTAWALVGFALLVVDGQNRVLPAGLSYLGREHPTADVEFLADLTFVDANGVRHVEQTIFDEVFRLIGSARRFLLLDLFLYNPYQGNGGEGTRLLSGELTQALIEKKRNFPDVEIIVITDPVNTVYGGLSSAQFERLRDAGVAVVITRLEGLRDSNPLYSLFWRFLIQPFRNGHGQTLPNPFGEGRVSVRSYLSLLNFKANHRKVVIADNGDQWVGLVTSANPHDGSSAHGNIALRFSGAAVAELLETEKSVLRFSATPVPELTWPIRESDAPVTVQVLTESKIKDVALGAIEQAGPGDALNLAMFYLSDRDIVNALRRAHEEGVALRVLLDPNKDAFGLEKNGVPGRPVAYELHRQGIPVRWCDTHGEQCHAKLLLVDYRDGSSILVGGSANFTRRNLDDLNLETNVAVRGRNDAGALMDARRYFELVWGNEPGRRFSTDYASYADESFFKGALYRFMEASGFSTF